jgi:hypothetical protein
MIYSNNMDEVKELYKLETEHDLSNPPTFKELRNIGLGVLTAAKLKLLDIMADVSQQAPITGGPPYPSQFAALHKIESE